MSKNVLLRELRRVFDIHVYSGDRFRSELNVIALKLATLNFPRLIKRCLINLPSSLEEQGLNKRAGLVRSIRNLYYSEKDKDTFALLQEYSADLKKSLVIDNVASVYYSNMSQLPQCYHIMREASSRNKWEKNWIFDSLVRFQKHAKTHDSALFALLDSYNRAADISNYEPSEYQNTSLPYYNQLTSDEKNEIFEPLQTLDKRRPPGLGPIVSKLRGIVVRKHKNGPGVWSWDHTVIRGELVYTELLIDNQVYGCGLDFNRTWAMQRLAKLAISNPKLTNWLIQKEANSLLLNGLNELKHSIYEKRVISSLGNDEPHGKKISRFFLK